MSSYGHHYCTHMCFRKLILLHSSTEINCAFVSYRHGLTCVNMHIIISYRGDVLVNLYSSLSRLPQTPEQNGHNYRASC